MQNNLESNIIENMVNNMSIRMGKYFHRKLSVIDTEFFQRPMVRKLKLLKLKKVGRKPVAVKKPPKIRTYEQRQITRAKFLAKKYPEGIPDNILNRTPRRVKYKPIYTLKQRFLVQLMNALNLNTERLSSKLGVPVSEIRSWLIRFPLRGHTEPKMDIIKRYIISLPKPIKFNSSRTGKLRATLRDYIEPSLAEQISQISDSREQVLKRD